MSQQNVREVPMSLIGHVKHSRLTIREAVRNILAARRQSQGERYE